MSNKKIAEIEHLESTQPH